MSNRYLTPIAFALGAIILGHAPAIAQDSTITLSAGSENCTATLLNLEINPDSKNVSAEVESLENCLGAAGPTITSFTVNSESSVTLNEGDEVAVSWNSSNTTACRSGGTLPGWATAGQLPASGTFDAGTDGLANGTYTLSLTCFSSTESETVPDREVVVENSSVTGECSTRPPVSLTRATGIVADRTDNAFLFESVFENTFPGSGNVQQIRIRSGEFAAMEFKTDAAMTSGALGQIQSETLQPPRPSTASTSAFRMWSISTCPGDFRKNILDQEMGPGCVQGGGTFVTQGSFAFGGDSFITDSNVCGLEPDKTYFLNLLYTDQEVPTSEQEHNALDSICPDEFCGNGIQPTGSGFK